jgi:putative ABC transport system substrate-binding protein
MKRRDFITLLGGAAAWPVTAKAQQGERVRRIGVLTGFAEDDLTGQALVAAFRQRLVGLGWVEGRNVRIEVRWAAAGNVALMRTHAIELARLAPEVMLVHGSRALAAVQREMHETPIVFAGVPDPVTLGFVASLARPGGKVTGFTTFEGSNIGKLADLLKEVAPGIDRVAMILAVDFANAGNANALDTAAAALGLKAVIVPVKDPAEIAPAIEMFAREPNGSLLAPADQTIVTFRQPIIAAATGHRVPAVYGRREFVVDGGLVSYGVDIAENYRNAAGYADRILRGEKAADLPVQQPTKFELVVNLKAAKAIGLTIPESFLLRADEVIE